MGDFYTSEIRTARKPHKCKLCREWIQPGEKYCRDICKYDGRFHDAKLHIDCDAVIDKYIEYEGSGEWDDDSVCDWIDDDICGECVVRGPDEEGCTDFEDCPLSFYQKPGCKYVLKYLEIGEENGET